MHKCDCHIEIQHQEQRRTLIFLFMINAVMFFIELAVGILGQSMGLIADAIDMFADALVYAVGLYAVGKAADIKARAAYTSGIFQMILAVMVVLDVVRRFVWGSEPESLLMMFFGFIALCANVWCLLLIEKYRHGEIHMRASWIFSKNDVVANIGVILGGIAVYIFDSHLPDLLVGLAIAMIVFKGGLMIIQEASKEARKPTA